MRSVAGLSILHLTSQQCATTTAVTRYPSVNASESPAAAGARQHRRNAAGFTGFAPLRRLARALLYRRPEFESFLTP